MNNMSLFPSEKIVLDLPQAEIEWYPNFLNSEQSKLLFERLLHEIPWQQDEIKVYEKNHLQPRLTALFGNEGKPYSYSNIVMQPHPWNSLLTYIKEEVETVCSTSFTTVAHRATVLKISERTLDMGDRVGGGLEALGPRASEVTASCP